MPGLTEKLAQDVAEITWQDLLPHAKRDAIIIIQEELEISEVATAIAEDNTASVQGWIDSQSISKPTADQLTAWNQTPQKLFIAVIVQPFVIIKEINK
ncbi:MAG: DUF2288 family protein [Waterburya sp.]